MVNGMSPWDHEGEVSIGSGGAEPEKVQEETNEKEINIEVLPDDLAVQFDKQRSVIEQVSDPTIRKEMLLNLEEIYYGVLKNFDRIRMEEATDELTRLLFKRKYFVEAVEKGSRSVDRGALIFIDMNGMKKYNDVVLGYEGTNDLIRQFAALADDLRVQDVTLRYGGDEFVIYMPGANPNIIGQLITKRMMAKLQEKPIVVTDSKGIKRTIVPTFCVGVTPLGNGQMQEDVDRAVLESEVSRLITESSDRTKSAKNQSGHDKTVLAYVDNSGKEHVVEGESLFH